MLEIKDNCYKGTRILLGNEKRQRINKMIEHLYDGGFTEIQLPIIQMQETFKGKVGEENNNLMFNFEDRASRKVCLAPEYTAVVQGLDLMGRQKLFYVAECFRGEKPQRGRWRQFTQLGVEIINPEKEDYKHIVELAEILIKRGEEIYNYTLTTHATRGLDYYVDKTGFEIHRGGLQIVGGGAYEGGVGFAIGIDRLMIFE